LPDWFAHAASVIGTLFGLCLVLAGVTVKRFLIEYERFKTDMEKVCGQTDEDHQRLSDYKKQVLDIGSFLSKIDYNVGQMAENQNRLETIIINQTKRSVTNHRVMLQTMVQICRASGLDCSDVEALYQEYRTAAFRELATGEQISKD